MELKGSAIASNCRQIRFMLPNLLSEKTEINGTRNPDCCKHWYTLRGYRGEQNITVDLIEKYLKNNVQTALWRGKTTSPIREEKKRVV